MIDFSVYRRQMMIQSFVTLDYRMILEVGCGTGYFTNSFITPNNFVVAIDPNQKSIEMAKVIAPYASFIMTDFENYNSKEIQFDVIVFSRSFHEMKNQEQLISRAKQLCEYGGNILIIEPNLQSQYFSVMQKIYPPIYEEIKKIVDAQEVINSFSPMKTGILQNSMHFKSINDFWKICLDGDESLTVISILDALKVKLDESFFIENSLIMYLL